MILPIYVYGTKVLKKKAEEIQEDYPNLEQLLENMWETMYNANGVGLAAPQIGKSIRIFIIDTTQVHDEEGQGVKKAFINPVILEREGEEWTYEEGCLSIPEIRGDVDRPPKVTISYFDETFSKHTETYDDIEARVIQHEFDHLEGILFTELLKPVKKRRVRRRLENMRKGEAKADYPLRFS